VVISDQPVGSPVVRSPHSLVAMNLPSLDKFEPFVRPGGLIVINSSLIDRPSRRSDVEAIVIACNQIAMDAGSGRAANMVALGALVGRTRAVPLARLEDLVRETFEGKAKLIDINLVALRRGHEAGAQPGVAAQTFNPEVA
jgi:2-oxoglutarate ferredoxin oxidoreductase subunit gamma